MKIIVQVENDLPVDMKRHVDIGARAVSAGVSVAATQIQTAWRAQITGAGLGNKLAKSIRADVYPKGRPSPNAAALVYSKAPKLISAHDTGPLIRSQSGFWLAIPLPAAGKGARGAKITPGQWEKRTGRQLRFVYRQGKSSLLVADDARLSKSGIAAAKNGKRRKDGILSGARTVPIFVMVPQVKLRKRLDLETAARAGGLGLPARIRAAWSKK